MIRWIALKSNGAGLSGVLLQFEEILRHDGASEEILSLVRNAAKYPPELLDVSKKNSELTPEEIEIVKQRGQIRAAREEEERMRGRC